ncbi:MAG: MarR family winged helix-turn-helix transcriptional regulator [Alphaproteobacteria bacterium]
MRNTKESASSLANEEVNKGKVGTSRPPVDPDAPFDLDLFVPFLLNRAATRVAGSFSKTLKDHGLSITTWRLLASLYQHESLRIGELSDFTSIELWTVSRMVSRLEDDGLLRRERVGGDARTVNAALTSDGRKLVEALIPKARDQELGAVSGFTPEEVGDLQKLLRKIYHNLTPASV